MSALRSIPENFLKKEFRFALADASNNRFEESFHLYQILRQAGFSVAPVNPREYRVQGDPCFPDVKQVRPFPDVVIFSTAEKDPNLRGLHILKEMRDLGIFRIWIEPLSETSEILKFADENHFEVMTGISLRKELQKSQS